jgi:hypothetical protein
MHNTDCLWFEVALVCAIHAVGGIFFSHFEVHTPKWRKVLKLIFFITITLVLSVTIGRVWALSFLGAMLLFVVYIHGFWLPSKGINGWTAEPKDKYYDLRGWKKKPE